MKHLCALSYPEIKKFIQISLFGGQGGHHVHELFENIEGKCILKESGMCRCSKKDAQMHEGAQSSKEKCL